MVYLRFVFGTDLAGVPGADHSGVYGIDLPAES